MRLARLTGIRALLPVLLALTLAPDAVRAQGKWDTYLHMKSCNDLLVLRDTGWVATGGAGLLRFRRATDGWVPRTGHKSLYRFRRGSTETRSRFASKNASIVPTSRQ